MSVENENARVARLRCRTLLYVVVNRYWYCTSSAESSNRKEVCIQLTGNSFAYWRDKGEHVVENRICVSYREKFVLVMMASRDGR